jgi:hypothetical protein
MELVRELCCGYGTGIVREQGWGTSAVGSRYQSDGGQQTEKTQYV